MADQNVWLMSLQHSAVKLKMSPLKLTCIKALYNARQLLNSEVVPFRSEMLKETKHYDNISTVVFVFFPPTEVLALVALG